MTDRPLHILFAGSGEFGLPTLAALIDAGHQIVQVISQPDRPAGRGRALTPTPIAAFASSRNLPVVKTSDINKEDLPVADLMVVIAFGQKIGEAAVGHPRLGSINLHASILPKYRGAAPINWAIIEGESMAGNSVIRLAARMDAGDVLAQSALLIGELETAGELHDRLSANGAPLILRVIEQLSGGTVTETPQDETQATFAGKLSRETSKIDWNHKAVDIANQIRGMYPWPGCRVRLIDRDDVELARVTLVRSRSITLGGPHPGGSHSGDIDLNGFISAGGGAIEIVELQPEGKRPMSLEAFRNGHPWEAGSRLESIG